MWGQSMQAELGKDLVVNGAEVAIASEIDAREITEPTVVLKKKHIYPYILLGLIKSSTTALS